MLKAYSYLFEIMEEIVNNKPLSIHEVNLVGGRKSGKTIACEIFVALLTTFPNLKLGIFFFRYGYEGIIELFNEFCDTLDSLNINYKASRQRLHIIINGYKVRFYFASTMKKSKAQKAGMARVTGVDKIIRFWDERYQFPEQDVMALKEAVRGVGAANIEILDLNACNPWAKSSPYINYCASFQNWDLNVLKDKGSQIGVYEKKVSQVFLDENEEKVELNITRKIVVHYTNWRIVRNYLGDSEIAEILNTWNIDRNRAMTVDYGMPGYESGAIYTHELHKISKSIYQEHTWLFGGGDYGWSQRESGGKTAFVFGGASIENGIDVYGEYIQDNYKAPKSVNIVVREVVDFYIMQMESYCRKLNLQSWQQLRVRVDNMAREFVHLLNQEAKMRGHSKWLTFTICRKYPIQDRIVFLLAVLGSHYFRQDTLCRQLHSDLEMASYEDIETQKRMKKYDHCLNALEYACEPFQYAFVKILASSNIRLKL